MRLDDEVDKIQNTNVSAKNILKQSIEKNCLNDLISI